MSLPSWSSEEHKPAPPQLLDVQALVNTRDLELGTDALDDDADARRWAAEVGLVVKGRRIPAADLQLLREVRESLRALIAANTGDGAATRKQLEPLNRLAGECGPGLAVTQDGKVELAAAGGDLRAGIVELLLRVRDAQRDGTWEQLKLCANPDCRWAFYDLSRNHQGTWCRMEVCGNRLKNRRLRARQGS
jgi:predicted RNA-binding Zn ribbon-like protein